MLSRSTSNVFLRLHRIIPTGLWSRSFRLRSHTQTTAQTPFKRYTTASHNTHSEMSPESLPTLHRLGVATVPDSSPKEVANEWLHKLSTSLTSQNLETVKQLFIDDACWKDVLALTWDYRSIQGCNEIHSLIHDRVATSGFLPKEVSLDPYYAPALRTPFSDLSWIQFGFDFETSSGKGLGYVRLVPTADGTWKCYTLCTSLEALSDPNPRVSTSHYHD